MGGAAPRVAMLMDVYGSQNLDFFGSGPETKCGNEPKGCGLGTREMVNKSDKVPG